ncbi:wax ester/triacylglycerol synthase family O-acyltransferase [Sphaerisporangium sp. B11E5]|uniref:WS/DGAT/MGAT family O-acyltransferase n=1 Tax=Sphaerisporangium sp. B11E5 TaxID=3153563 RepID=UPI00325F80B1
MRQLSALDAQFLHFETETNVANVAGLSILDGPLGREELVALVEERAHLVEPLRRRLVNVPFGLDHPYWAEDDDIDLDYHVRELALPAPGNDTQLGEQVARLHARRLDRRRPLWEMYLIHGLEGGRTALYTKIHHAAIDGMYGAGALAALMDLSPAPEPLAVGQSRAPHPDRAPETAEMLLRTAGRLLANPAHLLRFLAEAMPRLDEIPVVSLLPGAGPVSRATRWLTRKLGGGVEVPELPRLTVPRTPFNAPVSAHRRFAFVELSLDDVKQVKKAFGVTVNDVVMTLAATAVRRWLVDHDALPAEPLVAGVPFSLRTAGGGDAPGNQVTLMITPLDTRTEDPAERLRAVHESMSLIKERFALAPARWLRHLSESMPAALTGLADRAAFGLVAQTSPPINLMVSNVPGPQIPLYVCGRRLLAQYPVSVVTDASGGLNITAFSYDGRIAIGIVSCRLLVPDVWTFTDYFREALDELRTLPAPG